MICQEITKFSQIVREMLVNFCFKHGGNKCLKQFSSYSFYKDLSTILVLQFNDAPVCEKT